ncbi:MAG: PEP-CTERM sorting domain-containing protein [Phycisphaerales bacterium]
MNYHARILTACAAAFALSATTTMAATVTVNVHPASAAQISSDAALANATIIDLLVDSQGDDLLSFDLILTTTGTIYNHPLENPNDAAPNPAAVLSFPALGADSHVAFGTPLGGDLSSPSGSFPLSVGGPLPSVSHNGLVARVTVLNDPGATIDGTVFFSADGVTSYDIQYTSMLMGDLNSDGFVGIADLNIVLGNWNQNVTPGDPTLGDPSGDGFVGITDLNKVLGNWNAGTPPTAAAVPEPATLGMIALGGLAMLRRR